MVGTSNQSVPKMAIDRMPVWVHNHHNPTLTACLKNHWKMIMKNINLVASAITILKNMKVNGKDYPISADPGCARGSAKRKRIF